MTTKKRIASAQRMAPAQLPADLHKWLRIEAANRDTTITAELTEAVLMLREQREGNGRAQARRNGKVQPVAVQP